MRCFSTKDVAVYCYCACMFEIMHAFLLSLALGVGTLCYSLALSIIHVITTLFHCSGNLCFTVVLLLLFGMIILYNVT